MIILKKNFKNDFNNNITTREILQDTTEEYLYLASIQICHFLVFNQNNNEKSTRNILPEITSLHIIYRGN